MPLIIRGARQVGKTYAVENLGKTYFSHFVTVDFELQPKLALCFDDLDPKKILLQIEARLACRIIPGKTLLFLDEIQQCPNAIRSLRYFKEKLPELHVLAAGSLLEFALHDEAFSFPVGRVEFFYMHPLSFIEYLEVTGKEILCEQLASVSLIKPPSLSLHEQSLEILREYFLLGGMPAVVQRFIDSHSWIEANRIQRNLLSTYEKDFGKYASQTQYRFLQRLFERAPDLVGSHIKYSKIDPTATNPARDYKIALEQLVYAGLIYPIYATAANGIPLRAEINRKKFKILFLDIGLLQQALGVPYEKHASLSLLQINTGALAEQFVGQELLVRGDPYEAQRLYFWERERKGSSAELDYIMRIGSQVVPIEVKAGTTGRLRSLKLFMEEKSVPIGIRIAERPLSKEGNILSIPLYLIHRISELGCVIN